MNFKKVKYSFFLLLILQIMNCESKSSDDEEKLRAAAGMVINRLTGTTTTTASSTGGSTGTVGSTCSNLAPSFSTLASAGVNSSCARSGCHVGSSPQNGLDMSSYSSVITKVTPSNANGSTLYQKVNGGSMQIYTTSTINTAIYCWIQGGALP